MKERQLNKKLLDSFPELIVEFDEYTSWQDGIDTGSFLVFEDVFRPYLEKAVINNQRDILDKSASFIEGLLLSEDPYAKNVVVVGVLEGLKANCENDAVRSFIGKEALKEFDELDCLTSSNNV